MADLIHHPVFQSLVLPVLLSVLGIAVLRAVLGPRHAAWGGLLGLLGAWAWMPGLDWPALARTQKLPWIAVAALGLAALQARRSGRSTHPAVAWLVAVLVWAAAAVWLGGGQAGAAALSVGALGAALLFGGAVLALLALPARGGDGAQRPVLNAAVLTCASLGLAGLGATGGSLLLAQLALTLASCVAVVGLWAVVRPGSGPASGLVLSPGVLLAFGLAWLAIGASWLLAAPAAGSALQLDAASALRLLVLALAFAVPVALQVLPSTGRAARWRLGITLLLAAVPVLVALTWTGGGGSATLPEPGDDADDLYLTPPQR